MSRYYNMTVSITGAAAEHQDAVKAAAEAEDKVARRVGNHVTIPDTNEDVVRHVRAVDESANLLHDRIVVDVELALGGAMEQLEVFEQARPGASPVAGAFVATTVRGVGHEESV